MKSKFDQFGIGRGQPLPAIDARWVEHDENDDRPLDHAIADLIRRWLDDREENPKTG